MAKNVLVGYQQVYDEMPYHVKESLGLPVRYYELNVSQIQFLESFMGVTKTLIMEQFQEEKENIRMLAEEMTAACSAIMEGE